MRSNSYGALQPRVASESDQPGYASSCRSLQMPNEEQDASPGTPLLQSTISLPTVAYSDGAGTPAGRNRRKRKKRRFRPRKETWAPGDRQQSRDDARHFSPMTFVTPPYLFPPWDEISKIEHEEEERRRSSVGGRSLSKKFPSAGEQIADESTEEEKQPLPPLTKKQIFTIVMLAIANFCSTVVFSCIAPFFPSEAEKKGASQTVIGLIFGVFELTIFVFSPIFGRYMTQIGSKFMYGAGLLVTGTTSILFGLLNLVPAGSKFIGLCFAVRITEAIGDSAFITASFAIIAHEFPGRTSTIIGLLETFSGLGFTAGPPIGGALYQVGGYQTPFIVLGCFLLFAGVLAVLCIPKQDDTPRHKVGGIWGLFRYPAVFLMCFAIMSAAACLSFLDPTLENHLSKFNLSPLLVGFMFLAIGGTYTVTAPLWGYFVDRTIYSREVMIFGALATMVGMFFLGPSPITTLDKTLWLIVVSEIVLGLGIGALFIPTFQNTLNVAREKGYPDSFETYGLVSGLFQSCFSFGGFFGPTVFGGAVVGAIGFSWTATILAGLNLFVGIGLLLYQVNQRLGDRRKAQDAEKNINNQGTKLGNGTVTPDSGVGQESAEI